MTKDTSPESAIYLWLDKEYRKKRQEFEEQRENDSNKHLLERAIKIVEVSKKSKNPQIETLHKPHDEPGTMTLSVAELEYGNLIKSGEDGVALVTDWFPYEKRTIDENLTDIEIRFIEHAITSAEEEGVSRRLLGIVIEGRLKDKDEVETKDVPIAVLREDKGKYLVTSGHPSKLKYGTPDYQDIEKMIAFTETHLGIITTPPDHTPFPPAI